MKVILTRDVPKVGKDGEIVLVANGYARNYLFPRQLAVVAKGAAMKQHENRVSREVAKGAAQLTAAQTSAEKLNGMHFQIVAKASPKSTRLFGAVTEADVAQIIQSQLGIEVDKRRISLIDPIKTTGSHSLTARLHTDVTASFDIEVVTQEQLEARERAKVLAEEKAVRDAAKAAEAEQAAAEAAEARAAARAEREASNPTPRAPRRERSEWGDVPDAEG
jgi:large subunit ribosomal protein L9